MALCLEASPGGRGAPWSRARTPFTSATASAPPSTRLPTPMATARLFWRADPRFERCAAASVEVSITRSLFRPSGAGSPPTVDLVALRAGTAGERWLPHAASRCRSWVTRGTAPRRCRPPLGSDACPAPPPIGVRAVPGRVGAFGPLRAGQAPILRESRKCERSLPSALGRGLPRPY